MELKTIKVSKELHQDIKLASIVDDKTMHEIVRESFELYKNQRNIEDEGK